MKGLSIKLTSPGFDQLPDRLVLLPNGKIGFIEVAPEINSDRFSRKENS